MFKYRVLPGVGNRIVVFSGHYGSGKSELAANASFAASQSGLSSVLIDLDLEKPFFRSSDLVGLLTKAGVKVSAPAFARTNSDSYTIPADARALVRDVDNAVFIDCGGDESGAKVLKQLLDGINPEEYALLLVVNVKRPETKSVQGILDHAGSIESASGIRLSGLINNSNLMNQTTLETIEEGYSKLKKASIILGIPIVFTSGLKSSLKNYKAECEVFFIERLMKESRYDLS